MLESIPRSGEIQKDGVDLILEFEPVLVHVLVFDLDNVIEFVQCKLVSAPTTTGSKKKKGELFSFE